jgi:hypothetical protein
LVDDMQQSLAALRRENAQLQRFLVQKLGSSVAKTALMAQKAQPTERFLQQLQANSNNRVVDTKTLRFLQGLRHNIVADVAIHKQQQQPQQPQQDVAKYDKYDDDLEEGPFQVVA